RGRAAAAAHLRAGPAGEGRAHRARQRPRRQHHLPLEPDPGARIVIDTTQLPLPAASPENARFWEAAREGRLEVPQCSACGKHGFPGTFACRHCGAEALTWTPVSGRGRVFSYVVYHRVYHPAFKDRVPYVVAVIELDEGPRMLANVVGCAVEDVRC